MGIPTIIAIYLTVWWTVLFAVLPWGVTTHAEAGVDPQGGDPGATINPNLKRKFLTTTWISAVVVAVLLGLIHFHVIDLTRLPWRAA